MGTSIFKAPAGSQAQSDGDPVELELVNLSNQLPIVYVGITASLQLTLTNNTGSDVSLISGSGASTLTIVMPQFYTADEINAMTVTNTNWQFTAQGNSQSIILAWIGENNYNWAQQESLIIEIDNCTSNGNKSVQQMVVYFTGFNVPGFPYMEQTVLTLQDQPVPGNATLSDVLQVTLDNQGTVYVSTAGDPIENTLILNFKNTGTSDLFSGNNPWTTSPQVIVSFVYGRTAGAIAPADAGSNPGSAWNINGGVYAAQGNKWQIQNPQSGGINPSPQWQLTPLTTGTGIIGTGNQANISFDFSEIISQTPVGHTQMYVQFSNFPKNDSTLYNDELFVIDIVKLDPPPTRGLVSFFCPQPVIQINAPNTPLTLDMRWGTFEVDRATIIVAYPGMDPITVPITNDSPLEYGTQQITLPGTTASTAVTITMQAFNGNGGFLNSMQFTVFLQSNIFVDSRDGKVYPVIQVGSQLWMAQNLDYAAPSGSAFYNNEQSNEAQYGRLYTVSAASTNITPGWRLPNQNDWNNLISAFGDQAYADLLAGGSANFNAQLGGYMDNRGNSSQLTLLGCYWTQTGQGSNNVYAQFSSRSLTVSTAGSFPNNYLLSVRYVRDIS
ncbi:MAG: hypothetical protein IM638_10530 [Bacteroidetes bacterium]|nr:hypothetical protein [Bacteroidota bacterium]